MIFMAWGIVKVGHCEPGTDEIWEWANGQIDVHPFKLYFLVLNGIDPCHSHLMNVKTPVTAKAAASSFASPVTG